MVLLACGESTPEEAASNGAVSDHVASGTVRVWSARYDPFLLRHAGQIKDIEIEWVDDAPPNADLVIADLDRPIIAEIDAHAIAPLPTGYLQREPFRSIYEPVRRMLDAVPILGRHAVPVSIDPIGLWCNTDVLSQIGVSVPTTVKELMEALRLAKTAGYTPVSLGTAFAYPGLNWFSVLDAVYNGPDTYTRRLRGELGFADDSAQAVWSVLAQWRDDEWFDPQASFRNWFESLNELKAGDSVFALLGGPAADRLGTDASVVFARFPQQWGSATSNDHAVVAADMQVAAFPGVAPNPAAVALLESYIAAGSTGLLLESYQMSPYSDIGRDDSTRGLNQRERVSREARQTIMDEASIVVPTLQAFVPAHSEALLIASVKDFFGPGSTMNGRSMAERMERVFRNEAEGKDED